MSKEFWLKVIVLVIVVWFVVNFAGREQSETCYTAETADGVFTAKVGRCK